MSWDGSFCSKPIHSLRIKIEQCYGWPLRLLTFIFISFHLSTVIFISFICLYNRIEAITQSVQKALPQKDRNKKWTAHYPCGQKLMIWKIANKTKTIFHFVCMHFSFCLTEDAVLNSILATGNDFSGNACGLFQSVKFI